MSVKNAKFVSLRELERQKPWVLRHALGSGRPLKRYATVCEAIAGAEQLGRVVYIDCKAKMVEFEC